jgi:hypothetical protein
VRTRALTLALLLAGCGPVQSIDADFASLKGQTLAVAEARLGPPAARKPAANGSLVVWTNEVRDDTPVLQDKVIYENGRRSTLQVLERPDLPPLRVCTLTVDADAAGTILAVTRDGATAACAPLARKVAVKVFP